MSNKIKKIAVLTSGGDAPGMNAAIRAVVRSSIHRGLEIYGIERGYMGLLNKQIYPLSVRSVSDILERGGTMLHTARCLDFTTEEGQKKGVEICKEFGIKGIVVIGGDGSFKGARALSELGIPCVGIPGTIDNDIGASEYTIGFDTATETAMELVDKIRDTTYAHEKCHIVEVMGRHAGYIALETGIACGAFAILCPEVALDFEKDIVQRIKRSMETGKHHFIIVTAEGAYKAEELAKRIEAEVDIECRSTILGHVQRGGSPTPKDRVTASLMGQYAVDLLYNGKGNRVVVVRDGKIVDLDIFEALNMKKDFPMDTYKAALEISI